MVYYLTLKPDLVGKTHVSIVKPEEMVKDEYEANLKNFLDTCYLLSVKQKDRKKEVDNDY